RPRVVAARRRADRAPAVLMKVARLYYRLIKFEHTIFALPFAYVGAVLAVSGVPSAHDLLWITVAMVGARSLAMALNRLIDVDVDRAQGLHSWATRFGERGAFAGARALHLTTIALLVAAGLGLDVGVLYWAGVAIVGGLLFYEHRLVRPDDLRRLDAAFFTM